jgi:hypothetical protein
MHAHAVPARIYNYHPITPPANEFPLGIAVNQEPAPTKRAPELAVVRSILK